MRPTKVADWHAGVTPLRAVCIDRKRQLNQERKGSIMGKYTAASIVPLQSLAVFLLAIMCHITGWASGDPLAGKDLYEQKCTGCHAVDSNRVGPAHRGVVGRKVGTVAGFAYSGALKGSKVVWSEKTLNAWLSDPEQLIPGQAMYYKIDDERIRQNIVAYLATLK
jgi:cytochrome c